MNKMTEQWKEIVNAPKDGRKIIVSDGFNEYVARWNDEKNALIGQNNGFTVHYFDLYGLIKWREYII